MIHITYLPNQTPPITKLCINIIVISQSVEAPQDIARNECVYFAREANMMLDEDFIQKLGYNIIIQAQQKDETTCGRRDDSEEQCYCCNRHSFQWI